MGYTNNQVRHLYVAKANKDSVAALQNAGDICAVGDTAKKNILYFQYMSPGGIVATDKIDVDKILYVKSTASKHMEYGLKKKEITLKGDLVAGQEYILRIVFRNYIGMSDADLYYKYGMVKPSTATTTSDFYKELALSLVKNLGRETNLVKVYINSDSLKEVKPTTKPSELSASNYDKIVLEEVEQDWELGKMYQSVQPFDVQFLPITVDGAEVLWGDVKDAASTTKLGNGKKIAEMEYFYHGERGDIYRGMGYPNNITTKYLADITKKYDVLDIHYYQDSSNESVQKSERTLTIVADDATTSTIMKAIITKINTFVPAGLFSDPA